jgi:hypothetical protein
VTGDFTEISSWSAAAIAYAVTGSSPNAASLRHVCDNFTALTTRWVSAYHTPYGDVLAFAQSAVCAAANGERDPRLPLGEANLSPTYAIKTFLSGIFTIQAYHGDVNNQTYYSYQCWYLEDSLLEGLWLPNPGPDDSGRIGGGGVDVESSFCANSGGYAKGLHTQYTTSKVSSEIQRQAGIFVSEYLARGVKLLLKDEEQIEVACRTVREWKSGIKKFGLEVDVVEKVLCDGRGVLELEQATQEILDAMTKLFAFQLLHGGYDDSGIGMSLYGFLCEAVKEESFKKVRLDGKGIKRDICNAAAAPPTKPSIV